MLSPYENVIIGNFLYALGLAMGRQSMPVDGCVNLLQQTPADPALGDLMLQFPGVWRLVEFKRGGGDEKKEDQRRSILFGRNEPEAWQRLPARDLQAGALVCRPAKVA